jgi:hypothetical protein
LEYLASFQLNSDREKVEKDIYSARCETDINNDQEATGFCEKNGVKTNEKEDITLKSENESALESNLENDKLKSVASFSGKVSVKENFNSFEPHTCMKSTVSAGHRSLHIDLKSYALIMLQKLGAQQALKTISDTQLEKVFFMQDFYYKCILSSQLENHQWLVTGYLL